MKTDQASVILTRRYSDRQREREREREMEKGERTNKHETKTPRQIL